MDRNDLVTRVQQLYEAFGSGDPDTYRAVFAPDVVWHVPGNNPVSGRYEGGEYFTLMPQRMGPLDEWAFTVRYVLTNERDRAALVAFHLVGARRGERVKQDGFHLIRLDDAGRVVEGWDSQPIRTPWIASSRPDIHHRRWAGAERPDLPGRVGGQWRSATRAVRSLVRPCLAGSRPRRLTAARVPTGRVKRRARPRVCCIWHP